MKLTRFQTDRRLWFWFSLALFVVCWFLPFMEASGEHFSLAGWISSEAAGIFRSDVTVREFVGVGAVPIIFLSCSFAVASVLVGWLAQCVVVVIRARRQEKVDHVA